MQVPALGGLHDANLRQAAGKRLRGFHELAERDRTGWKRVIPGAVGGFPPMGRRAVLGRSVQIIAQRGTKSLLVSTLDAHLFDDRRPIVGRCQQLGQRSEFSLDLLAGEFGGGGIRT